MDSTTIVEPSPKNIKDAIDECLRGEVFPNVKTLDIPFDEIMESLCSYHGLPSADVDANRNFSKDKGRLFEFIFKTGVFIKCDTARTLLGEDTVLYEDLKPCRAFDYKSGWKGTSYEWGADVIVLDKTTNTVWAFTAKSKQNITLSKTEWQRMLNLDRNLEFLGKEIAIGFIVDDKNEFMKNRSSQLGNYKFEVMDVSTLRDIWDECRAIFQNYEWDLDKLAEAVREERIPYTLMPHQVEGENRAYNAFIAGEESFLFFWKCRAGKTLAALDLLFRRMDSKNVLLLTSYPSVNPEWTQTISDFMGFEDVVVQDVSGGHIQKVQLHPTKKNLVIVSLQDAVTGETENGQEWAKDKFSELEGLSWDAGILDEVHHGQETPKAIAVKNRIQCQRWLALSATPWKNIALGRFDRHNTHEWGIVDEGVAKVGNPKVYGKFPAMNFYLWEIDDKIRKELKEEYSEEQYPTMKKLFRTENGKLVHENLARKIFQNWHRKITEHSINPQNILAFLPDTSYLEPLANLLQELFVDIYEVGYTHSKDNPNAADVLAFRENLYAKAKKSGKGTIILAVGQLTTGVTLKQCDCILHLDDALSTAAYIQKSLRSQNPGDKKNACYIFDFNPNRALKCILSTALGTSLNKPISERVHDFLLNAAVQMISEGKWTEIDAEYLIRCGVEAQLAINRNLFNRGIINSDVLSSMDETDLYRQLVELPYLDPVTNEHTNKPTPLDPNSSGPGENKIVTEVIHLGEFSEQEILPDPIVIQTTEPIESKPTLTMEQKLERLMSNLCWLPAITRFKFVTIEEIIEYLDGHDEEKKEFEALISKLDEKTTFSIPFSYVKRLLNHKDKDGRYLIDRDEINKRLYCLVMDCRNDPGRANELMISEDQYKKIFGEVFTPAELVNEMLDKLPAEVWGNKDLTWCDPACGSGNFLYQAKIRLMEGLALEIEDEKEREQWIVEKMLFGVELQRKNCYLCMFKLDPNDEFKVNVACEDSLKFDFWGKKFDVVMGNPPYQEMFGNGRSAKNHNLWSKFISKGMELLNKKKYLCFITPPSWMSLSKSSIFDEVFKVNQILYLNLYGADKYFPGIGSTFSWYIMQKMPYYKPITIDCTFQKKAYHATVELHESVICFPMLINGESMSIFEKTIFAEALKFEVIRTSELHSTNKKDFMQKERDDAHPYRVRHTAKQTLWSSLKHLDYMNPKVVIPISTYYEKLEADVECGLTEGYCYINTESIEDAKLLESVLKSKLYRFLANLTRWSNWNTPGILQKLPFIQPVEGMTDADIYAHFNLTQEEIALIEEVIK